MKPRTFIPLLGAGALLIATGVAVQVASADEKPELTAEYGEAGFWTGGLLGTVTVKNPPAAEATDTGAPATNSAPKGNSENSGKGSGTQSGRAAAGPAKGSTPSVLMPADNRLLVMSIVSASGAKSINLMSLVPPVNGACELKWSGSVDLGAYGQEITDAVNAKINVI